LQERGRLEAPFVPSKRTASRACDQSVWRTVAP